MLGAGLLGGSSPQPPVAVVVNVVEFWVKFTENELLGSCINTPLTLLQPFITSVSVTIYEPGSKPEKEVNDVTPMYSLCCAMYKRFYIYCNCCKKCNNSLFLSHFLSNN